MNQNCPQQILILICGRGYVLLSSLLTFFCYSYIESDKSKEWPQDVLIYFAELKGNFRTHYLNLICDFKKLRINKTDWQFAQLGELLYFKGWPTEVLRFIWWLCSKGWQRREDTARDPRRDHKWPNCDHNPPPPPAPPRPRHTSTMLVMIMLSNAADAEMLSR